MLNKNDDVNMESAEEENADDLHINLGAKTEHRVAVKRYYDIFHNPLNTSRFIREVRLLSVINHECINNILCSIPPDEDNTAFESPYLIFEYMEYNLGQLLKSNKYLELVQIKFIVYQLLCGLKYMQGLSIVHRDLKP